MVRITLVCAALLAWGCDGVIGNAPHSGGSGDPRGGSSDPSASAVGTLFACDRPAPAPSTARIVRLSGTQYAHAVDVLRKGRSADANRDRSGDASASPFQVPSSADRFSNLAGSYFIGEAEASAVLEAASSMATGLASDLVNGGAPCAADGFDEECARSVVRQKGALLFGHELGDDELDAYVSLATDPRVSALGTEAAVTTVMEALLSSPSFLFRTEVGEPVGDGTYRLTPFEIASAISYTLTDGPPDAELWNAAMDGRLADPSEIEAQVWRLLGPLEENAALERFIREYFMYGNVQSVAKDAQEFPFHDARGLDEDTTLFVREALRQADTGSLIETLLTADWGYARTGTAESYNLSGGLPDDGSPELVSFVSGRRAGIMTQPSWLVAFSKFDHNNPIRRGKFIRESLLCGNIPAIDIGMIEPLVLSEDMTMRESLEQHQTDPSCIGCHSLMDPLGLAFAEFDHVGRERDIEAGRPVDATGEVTGSGSQDGPFDGAAELMSKLAASENVRQCFVAHAYEYFRGTRRTSADGCALTEADEALQAADGDFVALISSFFTSDEFLVRLPAEAQ